MNFLERNINLTSYLGIFVVTLWPFINLVSSPINVIQAPYYEYGIEFIVLFIIVLCICELIKRIFKIKMIDIFIVYSFLYISFLYYNLYSFLFLKKYFFALYAIVVFLLFLLVRKNKNFHFVFITMVASVFLYSAVEFLIILSNTKKYPERFISPDSIAFEFKSKPNIYFLLMDAFPRHDTLLEERDNSSFLEFFKNKEFIVSDNAYSNYPSTWPSLTATFQMAYLQEGDIIQDDVLSPLKEVFLILKKNNYDIVMLPSYLSPFNGRNIVDISLRPHMVWSQWFLPIYKMFQQSPIQIRTEVYRFLVSYAYFSMKEVEKLAFLDKKKPLFSFIHFMQFHDYAFDENCKVSGAHPMDVKLHSSCLEKLVEKTVNLLVSQDPNAIIIVQSDHGPWYWYFSQHQNHPLRFNRAYGIFSAIRFPNLILSENIKEYLQDSPSPVNNFRIIFSLLSEIKPELLPYHAFISEPTNGNLHEVTQYKEIEKISGDESIPNSIRETIFSLVWSLKQQGNTDTISNIIKFLLMQRGYQKAWEELGDNGQEKIIDTIQVRLSIKKYEDTVLQR